ncbi:ATP-dependent DNA helicase RecG [Vallicoccus soli]|uniref:Probable DNA 3'-5' helicase RecG n=1 Tax=Vallicoccus soli TaxID=2339232 RepID=A0A3A3Z486_9ACTN|nr:ATP-dependent DNA helicase RecG [Vallicoccus soli]RJK98242.1 ATP-dependent DNA helicase RecG [Vallicoccus soli]
MATAGGDGSLDLRTPLARVLGPRTATALEEGLGLRTVDDLLHHYPRRYDERGRLTDLRGVETGEQVTVQAVVRRTRVQRMTKRRGTLLEVVVGDAAGGTLRLTYFNQHWRERELAVGREGLFAGKVTTFRGERELSHPSYLLLDAEDPDGQARAQADAWARGLLPIYPASEKVSTWQVQKAVAVVLDVLGPVPDPVPVDVRVRQGVGDLGDALRRIHQPRSVAERGAAERRLRFDEALVLQLALARRRAAQRALPATPRRGRTDGVLAAFDARLPFALTEGQRSVGAEVEHDLAQEQPMHRLLQGEVGSGKTVVALRAMLAVVDAGGQAALLAPTEVLAQQHHRSISAMLGPLAQGGMLGGADGGTRVALLTGSQGAAERRRNLLDAASGAAGIVVGTHALLQEHVDFADLGLVVVDEQHRFGVEQRDALRAKASRSPHVLVMTATPIPRTVAMTVFGDLDVSTLSELPRGRSPIATHVVPVREKPAFLDRAWQRVREEVAAGHRAYVVCPRIGDEPGAAPAPRRREDPARDAQEEVELLQALWDGEEPDAPDERRPAAAVLEVAPMLAEGPLHGLRVGVLHGRMAPEHKDEAMRRFAEGETDVLVATTVVEVGVDVPEATAMVVLDADRFGVSQLHQLRGRVGRGAGASVCLLVTEVDGESPAGARLQAVAATTDGFEIARVDLETRREGDVLGASQSGRRSSLKLLRVLRDEDVIRGARAEAQALVDADPTLATYPGLHDSVAAFLDDERTGFLEKG